MTVRALFLTPFVVSVAATPLLAQDAPEKRLTIEVDSVEVAFELRGAAVVALAEEIRRSGEDALAHHLALFGSLPDELLGSTYDRITISIVEEEERRGEADGNRIDITMPPPEEALDHLLWKGVLAHELFHLWNSESFRYATVEEQWLSEGFTQYYTLRALGRMGVLDEPTYFFVLGKLLGMYLADSGLGSLSMREAGPVKQEHTGLVEGGGLAVALCLDVDIRMASGGERSLDDVMRLLFARHDAAEDRYAIDDVQGYVTEVRQEDRTSFFRDYVAGTATLPLAECLAPAGLTMTVEEGEAHIAKRPDIGVVETHVLGALRGL